MPHEDRHDATARALHTAHEDRVWGGPGARTPWSDLGERYRDEYRRVAARIQDCLDRSGNDAEVAARVFAERTWGADTAGWPSGEKACLRYARARVAEVVDSLAG